MTETADDPERPDRGDESEEVDEPAEDESADTLTFDGADPEFRQTSDEIGRRFRDALDRLA